MIGLLDYDWCVSNKTSVLLPNLEIMKLATYYTKEEKQFCRLLTLHEKELNNYDKIYFFSEKHKNLEIPKNFLQQDNVIFGGTALTKGKYIPFENEIIDYTIPKPSIYKEFLKQKYNNGVKSKVIGHVLDDTYYRNYAGKNKLPLPAIIPKKRVFLYDRDFFYQDWQETLDTIISHAPASIVRLHPVHCHTLTEYFTLRNYPKFSRLNDIVLDLKIPTSEIPYMLSKYKKHFLADILKTSNVYITLGGSLPSKEKYFKDFIYKLNFLYSFWSKGILLRIKFEEPDYGYDNPLYNISKLIDKIFNISYEERKDNILNERIEKKQKNNLYIPERDLLLKAYPSAKDLFYQSFNIVLNRGYWLL